MERGDVPEDVKNEINQHLTEHRLYVTYQEMSLNVLNVMGLSGSIAKAMPLVVSILKMGTGFDAIGIRLKQGADYPYISQDGFCQEFIELESSLLVKGGNDNDVCMDNAGQVKLSCTCGLVLSGNANHESLLFTPGGSFLVNDSALLLDLPVADDPRKNPRNTCMHFNYSSIALIPIRNGNEIIGILQLNDKRKNCFTLESVRLLEMMATYIGINLMQKHAEEKGLEMVMLLEKITHSLPGMVYQYRIDAEGVQTLPYVSESVERIFGVKRSLAVADATTIFKKIISKDLPGVTESIKISQTRLSRWCCEFRIKRDDNRIIWLEVDSMPERLSDGSTLWHGYITDITERKSLQKALIRSERMNAIGELSAGIAHDFNNSLQMIMGNIELAMNLGVISVEAKAFLVSARKCISDTAARVKSLQRFSSRTDGEFVTLDINELLEDVIVQSKPLWKSGAEKQGIKYLLTRPNDKVLNIDGNRGELSLAFYNLLKNAIEAMPTGGSLRFETGLMPNGAEIFIRISDSGKGMSKETKYRAFQPFFSTKGLAIGHGLGLSGVYSVIRDHFGTIKIKESKLGIGTTIEVVLPLSKGNAAMSEIVARNEKIAKILWVEDDESVRDIGRQYIEIIGHEIDLAASGMEALELLEANSYDLLITDIGMQGMSGWQLASVIKGKYEKMKIAIVSGWGASITSTEKEEHNISYLLSKPIKIDDLRALIDEAMKKK